MMAQRIPYSQTQKFSALIIDYLNRNQNLASLYHRFPSLENFELQLEEKGQSFPISQREVLVNSLQDQYKDFLVSEATQKNIELLQQENTFTITTGHQLNLFTGPLYFLYKIISTVNLTKTLRETYPNYNFVPVYWMATEDHDFEEINFFNLHGKKFQWNPPAGKKTGGAVGELPTQGLDEIFNLFSSELGNAKNAEEIKSLFRNAYLEHDNLAEATRYLANALFKEQGLVILDANNEQLKRQFSPIMERELVSKVGEKAILKQAGVLENLGHPVQANPREINLFYMKKGLRERIIEEEGKYVVNNTKISWNKAELLEHLKEYPQRFSPNVVLRPLYQECILPNLCYIGGGGELAYWLELKAFFDAEKVPFPILMLRNSALLLSKKQEQKLQKLNITPKELFLKKHELINRKVRDISKIDIDFTPQKAHLEQQFQHLYHLAKETDASFLGAVKAQETKQKKGLDKLEKRLLKAQRRKLGDEVARMVEIQKQLFPNESLQERQTNFSEFYLEYGEELIAKLMDELKPLQFQFKIISL